MSGRARSSTGCRSRPTSSNTRKRRMRLSELLGTELPLIQAPMAGVQLSALAAAVSNAGGLGSLPCAMLAPDGMRKELNALTGATQKPFNVNFFCHTPPPPDEARERAWRAKF